MVSNSSHSAQPFLSVRRPRDERALILLAVLLLHALIIFTAMRAGRQPSPSAARPFGSLLFLLLPNEKPSANDAAPRGAGAPAHVNTKPRSSRRGGHAVERDPAADSAITPPIAAQAPSNIDWEHEAKLAAQNGVSSAEKEKSYRNLAALSESQMRWVRENHLEPAPPGISWTYRRVEVVQDGLPIIHINDHCIAVPFLMMMVFCKIGHVEPKGDLFEHMRSPHDP